MSISFWRKEEPVLDASGTVVKGGMWQHQRRWWESKAFIKALVTGYGGGKAQPVRCPVLLSTGELRQLKNIKVGDVLIHPANGRTQKVVGVFPQGIKQVFRVDFSDSTHTWACGNHLWTVQTIASRKNREQPYATITTIEIAANLKDDDGNDRYTIPIMEAAKYPTAALPVHPYVMGCLLGSSVLRKQLKLNTQNRSVLSYVSDLLGSGYRVTHDGTILEKNDTTLITLLNGWNFLYNKKELFIPEMYLYADLYQRMALLQGLMDVAGTVTRKGDSVYFHTYSLEMVECFKTLIQQMGGVCYKLHEQISKKTNDTYYELYFNLTKFIHLFAKNDNAINRYKPNNKNPIRFIRNVTPIGEEECICIKVDNFDGLYITNDGIVTHNTMIGCKRAISVALHNAPSPYMWVSPSHKLAKKTAIPTLLSLLDGKRTLLKDFDYSFNKTDGEFVIHYKNRSAVIWVASGDKPESLKGPNLCAANIDEPFVQSKEVFDQMLARIRDPRAVFKELTLTGTPEELNWGYDLCEGEEKSRFDIEVIRASTRDNKAIGSEYADRLVSGYSEEAAKSYVGGQFTSLSRGIVYYGFSDANVIKLPSYDTDIYTVGMDFNVNPMAAVVYKMMGTHAHIVRCIELPNADTEAMCDQLQRYYPNRIAIIVPDASGNKRSSAAPGGKSDFYYIDKAAREYGGFQRMHKTENPKIRDRYNAVNAKFKAANGAMTLTIEDCPENKVIIKYLKQYAHEKLNLQDQKAMSHLLDAMGYPIAYFFPVIHGYTDSIPVVGA